MTSRDIYGHTYVYSDGTITEKPIQGQKSIICYYFSENDGHRFMRKGPERKIILDLDSNVTLDGLEQILKTTPLDKDAKEILQEMIKSGVIKTRTSQDVPD